jgi:hypothetical protein
MNEDIVARILESNIRIVSIYPYTSVRFMRGVNDFARQKVLEPNRAGLRVSESLSCSSVDAMDYEDTDRMLVLDKAMHLDVKRTRMYMGHLKVGR